MKVCHLSDCYRGGGDAVRYEAYNIILKIEDQEGRVNKVPLKIYFDGHKTFFAFSHPHGVKDFRGSYKINFCTSPRKEAILIGGDDGVKLGS